MVLPGEGRERDKDGLLQSKGNTICVQDRVRESAPPRPKMTWKINQKKLNTAENKTKIKKELTDTEKRRNMYKKNPA